MNATRTEAQNIMKELFNELEMLKSRVYRVQNITNDIIEEAQEAVKKYDKITQEYYNEVMLSVMGRTWVLEFKHCISICQPTVSPKDSRSISYGGFQRGTLSGQYT